MAYLNIHIPYFSCVTDADVCDLYVLLLFAALVICVCMFNYAYVLSVHPCNLEIHKLYFSCLNDQQNSSSFWLAVVAG